MAHERREVRGRFAFSALGFGAAVVLAGCGGMEKIDADVARLLRDAQLATRTDAPAPMEVPDDRPGEAAYADTPATRNPAAAELTYREQLEQETEQVIARLEGFESAGEGRRLDLGDALAQSVRGGREYRTAQETLLLATLDLLVEEHRWGPRFFATSSATVNADGDDGLYDASLGLVQDLGVTQRLPYGGEVSARALARATEDLHRKVAGEGTQSADIVLSADIPLLRGAGIVAQESRIQARRNIIYAARAFERFRREYLFDVASDYLELVVARRGIENARRNVASLEQLVAEQNALREAGRLAPFEADEAENDRLDAVARLNDQLERYRLSLDRFKSRIGIDPSDPIDVPADSLGLMTPTVDLDEAVRIALSARLDLQNVRDAVDDAKRRVEVARNDLLGDLDLSAQVSIPTDRTIDRSGLQFEGDDADFEVGLNYDWPLDRRIEEAQLREAQIRLARAERDYARQRDDVAIAVRGAVRSIDAALFNLQIQEKGLLTATTRKRAIDADPARATTRQKSDAIDRVNRAEDSVAEARRSLELAILNYLLASGQLRVGDDGTIEALQGMRFSDVAAAAGGNAANDQHDAGNQAQPGA